MTTLAMTLRELAGLFVDDGALALEILAIVAVAAGIVLALPDAPLLAGAVLAFGCPGVLLLNVMRAARW
jgi:hypothetical protein